MIYVYAITDRPQAPLPSQSGLHDTKLAKVIWHDLAAIVSALDGSHPLQSEEELWRHEEVLEQLMCDRAVLPVRFGTLLPSPQHMRDQLCRNYCALAEDVERVRGHVEIGLRFISTIERGAEAETAVMPDVGSGLAGADGDGRTLAPSGALAPPETGPGSAYLRARLANEQKLRNRQQARLRLVRKVYERLASHAKESSLDDDKPDDRHGTSAAFLVSSDRLVSFRELVGEVANAHPELALLCTGPWPPYSFVNARARSVISV